MSCLSTIADVTGELLGDTLLADRNAQSRALGTVPEQATNRLSAIESYRTSAVLTPLVEGGVEVAEVHGDVDAPPRPVVLHVLEAVGGGTARHLLDIVRHTPEFEHHVAVPSRRVGGLNDEHAAERMREAGAQVHIVEMRRAPVTGRNARALLALLRLVHTHDVDIVHGHSSVGGALARLAAARTGRSCVYTANGLATGRCALAIERRLARLTSRIVAVSASEAQLLHRRSIAPLERISVIPNGIEREIPASERVEIDLRATLGIPDGAPLVGTIARLVHQKAPERFVRIAATVGRAHPDAHFVLIGDGPLRRVVEQEIEESGLGDRFHLVDELPGAASVLDQFDVFVLASRFEGAPYAPLEAMRVATPVVLSDVVGNRDAVEHAVSGYLVAEHDTDAMARWVVRLLDEDDLRRLVGNEGRQRVSACFSVEQMCSQLAKVYEELLDEREVAEG